MDVPSRKLLIHFANSTEIYLSINPWQRNVFAFRTDPLIQLQSERKSLPTRETTFLVSLPNCEQLIALVSFCCIFQFTSDQTSKDKMRCPYRYRAFFPCYYIRLLSTLYHHLGLYAVSIKKRLRLLFEVKVKVWLLIKVYVLDFQIEQQFSGSFATRYMKLLLE